MDIQLLISQIKQTDDYFKGKASRTIDQYLTLRNWLIGFYIVEYEQNGEDRAEYGTLLLKNLSDRIETKGLSATNLKLFKQLYINYPQISQTVSDLLTDEIGQTVSAFLDSKILQTMSVKSKGRPIMHTSSAESTNTPVVPPAKLISTLSFSHLVELLKVDDPIKRTYYEIEAIKGVWSVRELKRQINSLNFERSAAAKDPSSLSESLSKGAARLLPEQIIKTPYVFDFLGLPDQVLGSESALEKALIKELKNFILELGHGFCFEAQQKRIIIGGEYYFIDLLFYHRILKCHVIIELKVEEFTHANAGQLNTYIQYYKTNEQRDDDNPPIGILLCTNKNEELVEYALGGMDENLFVSQYKTALPSIEELKRFLHQEKKKL